MGLKQRILSIDILRGIIMAIMALDHVRDYFHQGLPEPMDLDHTTPALFFTRWITHYCAPIFVFLSGISAYLSGIRRGRKELGIFLVKRGFWLLLMEVTIVTFGWTFKPAYPVFILQVIWAIGLSMVVLGLLSQLPWPVIFSIALVIICGHNLMDAWDVDRSQATTRWLWDALHHGSFPPYIDAQGVAHVPRFIVIYPVLPWIGIMSLGFCLGRLYEPSFDTGKRKTILLITGLGMIAVFAILRYWNIYGDPRPWKPQVTALYSLFDILHVQKYPPSLLFTCMTIGPAMLFLAFSEQWQGRLARWVTVFGRVPFFYYILHRFLIHLFAMIAAKISGYNWSDMILSTRINSSPALKNYGFDLPVVYAVWIALIIFLYPFCKWFENYKRTNQFEKPWLTYL